MIKTNAMRMLEQAKIAFSTAEYEVSEDDLSGTHAAEMLGVMPETVFKTLVAKGDKRGYLVFCVPVNGELDLKKCAAAAGDKRIELIPQKQLFELTGYLRGGCSPIGMKKRFPTYMDETAVLFDRIYISAGQRGVQLIVNPEELCAYLSAAMHDLCRD